MQAFHQELPKVLRAIGHILHLARRVLGKDDDQNGHNPGHQHRVGHGKRADVKNSRRGRRQPLFGRFNLGGGWRRGSLSHDWSQRPTCQQ